MPFLTHRLACKLQVHILTLFKLASRARSVPPAAVSTRKGGAGSLRTKLRPSLVQVVKALQHMSTVEAALSRMYDSDRYRKSRPGLFVSKPDTDGKTERAEASGSLQLLVTASDAEGIVQAR